MPLSTVISKSALGNAFRRLSTLKKKSLAFKKKKSPFIFITFISVDQNLELVCSGSYPCKYDKLKIKGVFNLNLLACNSTDILQITSRLVMKY